MTKKTDSDVEFDFGFSFVDENVEVKLEEHSPQKEEIEELQSRVDLLYDTITPFLDNLCRNPSRSTILWPNRVEKITEFKTRLKMITEGKHKK